MNNKPEVSVVYNLRTDEADKMVLLSDYEILQAECEKLRKDAVGLVAALEAIQTAATHKSIRTGIQAGTALGLIAALCDVALAARRKQGGDR